MTEPGIVGIVEDDESVRRSLCLLIESLGVVVRSYATGQQFLADPQCGDCDCLVLDVRMPGLSGLEVQVRLKERGIRLPTIFMSGYGDVPMAVQAMRNGALDFLQKPVNDQALLDKVQQAIELGRKRRDQAAQRAAVAALLSSLTSREREIMRPLVAGKMNKKIAAQLGISIRTVEEHRANILRKMGVRSIAELLLLLISSSREPDPTP